MFSSNQVEPGAPFVNSNALEVVDIIGNAQQRKCNKYAIKSTYWLFSQCVYLFFDFPRAILGRFRAIPAF